MNEKRKGYFSLLQKIFALAHPPVHSLKQEGAIFMEKYDSRMAHRVWNRVWAEPDTESCGHLLMCEAQALADYTKLQRQFPELKQPAEDIAHHIACLRGIKFLKEGLRPAPVTTKPREEPLDTALRRCYAGSLKAAGEYTALSEDPEYGCVYVQLAAAKRRHCRILLEIIGRTDKAYTRK